MSFYDYKISQQIAARDEPFYALIMAAMRKADDINKEKLERIFPYLWMELRDRYNAPAGFLPEEWEDGTADNYLRKQNDIDAGDLET